MREQLVGGSTSEYSPIGSLDAKDNNRLEYTAHSTLCQTLDKWAQ